MRNWTWKTWLMLGTLAFCGCMVVYNTWIKEPLSSLFSQEETEEVVTIAPIGSQIQTEDCRPKREYDAVRKAFNERQEAPGYSINLALDVFGANPECFTHEEIAQVRKRGYDQLYHDAYEEAANCQSWMASGSQRSSKTATDIAKWQGFIQDAETIDGRTLEDPFVPNKAKEADLAQQLMALALGCGTDPWDYNQAMEEVKRIIDPDLQQTTTLVLVKRFWRQYYRGEFAERSGHKQVDVFRQQYPLQNYWDAEVFASRELLNSHTHKPLPLLYVKEEGLSSQQWQDLVAFHVRTTYVERIEDRAQAYIEEGYDPTTVHSIVFNELVRGESYQFAIQYANQYLGARQVRIAENARIAQLERSGNYSIAIIGGTRTRIYPMSGR